METRRYASIRCCALVAALTLFGDVSAHGGDNWDPFIIDGVNDDARSLALKAQTLMSEVIRGRAGAKKWPLDGLREMHDELLAHKEVVDEILEHYIAEGTNVLFVAALHAEPRAGRTVAASRALDAGIAIIRHAATRQSADEFITEFYTADMTARLFELLEVNIDRMDLYGQMTAATELAQPDSLLE